MEQSGKLSKPLFFPGSNVARHPIEEIEAVERRAVAEAAA